MFASNRFREAVVHAVSAYPRGKLPDFNFPSDTRGVGYFVVSDTLKYYIPRFTSAATHP